MFLHACVHLVCIWAHDNQKKILDPMEQELQTVLSAMWYPEIEPRSTGEGASILNC